MRCVFLRTLALAALLAACDAGEWVGGGPDDAIAIADRFLTAVQAGDTDTAWSLVYPPSQQARFSDDRSSFDAIVNGIDLSGVTWEVTTARLHDGHYHVGVELHPLTADEDLAVFVAVIEGRAAMQVDIDPLLGGSGVVGG